MVQVKNTYYKMPDNNIDNSLNSRLAPADLEFFERIESEVVSSSAIPFNIPKNRFPRIVLKAAKLFWEWKEDCTLEQSLFIRGSDIRRNFDSNGNARLQLPSGIEGILRVWTTQSRIGDITLREAIRIPLLDTFGQNRGTSYNSYGSGGGNYGGTGNQGYSSNHYQISDTIIALYEYSQYENLLTRSAQFDYNRNSSILNVMSNTMGGSLVLRCFVRISMEDLYNDWMFEEYCISKVKQELGSILGSFDYQLPGGVKLNVEQLRSEGYDTAKEIEERLRTNNGFAGILTWT